MLPERYLGAGTQSAITDSVVVLASWLKGTEPTFRVLTSGFAANAWKTVDAIEIFGARS